MRNTINKIKFLTARVLPAGVALVFSMLCAAAVADAQTKNYYAHIKAEHRAAIKSVVGQNASLRPGQAAECPNEYGVQTLREAEGKAAHPYYAVRDFNRDKIKDFAVMMIDPRGVKDENFTLLVFNGDRQGGYQLAYRADRLILPEGGIGSSETMGGAKTALAYGEWQTDDCVYLRWNGKKYVEGDCSEGEN